MFDYLQKFNTLPPNLRESVSSPAAMAVILELENKYKIDLAATVMKVMTKIIPLADLSIFFVSDFSLDETAAKKLTAELKERLFFPVANYLGYNASYSSVLPHSAPATAVKPTTTFSEVDRIIKESGVSFASLDLGSRLKNILTTYLKGVRSRVDTRVTLNKEVISGGLGLDHKTIDKIFKIADEYRAGQILPSGETLSLPKEEIIKEAAPKPGLEKIRALYEKPGSARDIPYDLKAAITSGEIKKPVAPLNLPIPDETGEKLLVEAKPEIKPIPAPVNIKPVSVDAIKAAPAPVAKPQPTPEIKPVVRSDSDSDMSKLAKPPVKKPGMFSKLFGGDKNAVAPAAPTKTPPVIIPTVQSSVATMRSAAAAKPEPVRSPIISDLQKTPKVMGPLDELHYLDIVNFRRFGTSPAEAAAKVESKIKLLEKDGYDKMVSGVAFWRESPVNYLYLKMGQEALNKGLTLKQYAADCQTKDTKNCLSWEEIEAILALNSRLMF